VDKVKYWSLSVKSIRYFRTNFQQSENFSAKESMGDRGAVQRGGNIGQRSRVA